MFFLRRMLSMILSHFSTRLEAMQMSPRISLFWAHLCAVAWATPPAPMISTFFFTSSVPSLLGKALTVVLVGEFLDGLDPAVQPADDDRWHLEPIEPVLLDHGVAGRVGENDEAADFQLLGEVVGAENVARQAGL